MTIYGAVTHVKRGDATPDDVFAHLVGVMVQRIADDGLILCETKHDLETGMTTHRVRLEAARPREDD